MAPRRTTTPSPPSSSRELPQAAPSKQKQTTSPRTTRAKTTRPGITPPRITRSQTTRPRITNEKAAAAKLAATQPPAAQPPGPPPPASSATNLTYTPQQLERFNGLSKHATEHHIVDAADHIVELLKKHKINYAIMGGFALRIRGSRRVTFDVDLAVGANMLELRSALAADPRIRLPLGPVAGVMHVFVCTGGVYHEGLSEVPVCVDLICEASLGAPTNTLAASETITGATDRGSRTYRLLDIKHLLAAKLAAFAARGSSNDFDDLLWLLNSQYNAEIRGLSGTMPLEQRRALMAAAERKKPRIPAPRLRRYRHLLRLA